MDPATLSIVMPYVAELIDNLSTLAFFAIVIGLPSLAAVRIYRMRAGQRLHEDDAAALRGMTAKLQFVEDRMAALEGILDAEVPAWRGRYDGAGGLGRQAS